MKKVYESQARVLSVLVLMIVAIVPALHAQTFYSVPGLSFTKTFAGANPLPQVLTAASDGAQFNSDAVASTNTGGSWLQISPASGVYATPAAWVVSVNPTTSLAAGTYTGQVVVKQYPSGIPTMTVPVTLIITATGTPFFDDMAGASQLFSRDWRRSAGSGDSDQKRNNRDVELDRDGGDCRRRRMAEAQRGFGQSALDGLGGTGALSSARRGINCGNMGWTDHVSIGQRHRDRAGASERRIQRLQPGKSAQLHDAICGIESRFLKSCPSRAPAPRSIFIPSL